jgi:hypothetical protein
LTLPPWRISAFETVDREVQAAEASGFVDFLNPVDGEFCSGILFLLRHEARGLDEHATGTARGVEDAPVIRLDDFGEEADNAAGSVELAATPLDLLSGLPTVFCERISCKIRESLDTCRRCSLPICN